MSNEDYWFGCPHCGTAMQPAEFFCSECGKPCKLEFFIPAAPTDLPGMLVTHLDTAAERGGPIPPIRPAPGGLAMTVSDSIRADIVDYLDDRGIMFMAWPLDASGKRGPVGEHAAPLPKPWGRWALYSLLVLGVAGGALWWALAPDPEPVVAASVRDAAVASADGVADAADAGEDATVDAESEAELEDGGEPQRDFGIAVELPVIGLATAKLSPVRRERSCPGRHGSVCMKDVVFSISQVATKKTRQWTTTASLVMDHGRKLVVDGAGCRAAERDEPAGSQALRRALGDHPEATLWHCTFKISGADVHRAVTRDRVASEGSFEVWGTRTEGLKLY